MLDKSTMNIKLLDCTLRDGGFCLEDAEKQNIQTRHFSADESLYVMEKLVQAKIDYIELGAVELANDDKTMYGIRNKIEDFDTLISKCENKDSTYAVFFRGPDTPLKDVPSWSEKICPVIRLCIRYSALKESAEYCKELVAKGYKVFIQPMVTMRYELDEINYILEAANDMNAYAVYFVDSYGYMQKEETLKYFDLYDQKLDKAVHIGFHGHNNMNLAYANAVALTEINTTRNIILDSCIMGMGQGAGNLQTELIAAYLNGIHERYDYDAILDVCDYIDQFKEFNMWGYSVDRLLPAIHKVAYKYSFTLRHKYGFKYAEINDMLRKIPEELRHRYTSDNVKQLIELTGYKV